MRWATSPSCSSPDPLRALHAVAAGLAPAVRPAGRRHHRQHRQDLDQGGRRGRPRAAVRDAAHRGQPEQRGRAAADGPAARARARRGGPRDGDVRRRRDPRAGGDRPAVDRDRHRGPAGPPVADRLARRDRGRQGGAGRGPAAGRRRRGRDPQRRRRARAPDGVADARPGRSTYGFAPGADVRADEVESRGLDGMRFRLLTPAGDRRGRDRRPSDGSRCTTRWLATAAGPRRRHAARRRRARARRAVARRAPLDGDPRGRRRDRRRQLQRRARIGARRARAPGRHPGAAPDRRPGRDARAGRRPRRRPPRGRRRGRRVPLDVLVVVDGEPGGARGRGSSTVRWRPAWRRTGSIAVADAAAAVDAALARDRGRRRRAGQGVARHRARARRRRARRRRSAARSRPRDPRADPGPAARVRARRDPDAALHAPPASRRVRQADPRGGSPEPHGRSGGRRRWAACSSSSWSSSSSSCCAGRPRAASSRPLATLAFVGLLGAADDYLNARTGEGIRARQKLLWQTVVALVVAYQIQNTYQITGIRVPFVGDVAIDPLVYIFVRGVRDRGLVERRQHHRRPRRPRRRDARVRVRVRS